MASELLSTRVKIVNSCRGCAERCAPAAAATCLARRARRSSHCLRRSHTWLSTAEVAESAEKAKCRNTSDRMGGAIVVWLANGAEYNGEGRDTVA
eukprot:6197442-Pleurochrysis_carterae.AAC.1